MEQSTASCCKFILTTYDDQQTNHYYDTTFNLRPPFRPNSNGVYKVQMSECLFKNNEPTLREKVDWVKFTAHTTAGNSYIALYTVAKDWNTYAPETQAQSESMFQQFAEIINFKGSYITAPTGTNKTVTSCTISAIDTSFGGSSTDIKSLPQNMILEVTIEAPAGNIDYVTMEYSTNYAYLFNRLNKSYKQTIETPDATVTARFEFSNLRLGGAYLYYVETPLHTVVNSYNANNQAYNIIALVYNSNTYHNAVMQCVSSMELTSNDISKFRFRLLNDQCETVYTKEPVYIQLTVSNE